MSGTTVRFEASGFRVRVYGCERGPMCSPHPMRGPWHSILFMRRGMFIKWAADQTIVADANQTVFFTFGESYAVQFPGPFGDRVLELEIDPDRAATLAAEFGDDRRDAAIRPFPRTHMMIDSRTYLDQMLLWRTVDGQARVDHAATTRTVERLARRVMRDAARDRTRAVAHKPDTRIEHDRLVQAVQRLLAERFADPLTIETIADQVGSSPFHLSRVFRSRVGVSLHRYLMQLRLREALSRLLETPTDLTTLALRHGFNSHSHFTTAFSREFGAPPSRLVRRHRLQTSKD